jgi:prophage regulatory protein
MPRNRKKQSKISATTADKAAEQQTLPVPRLLSMRETQAITKYSRPSIYRLISKGLFPTPVKLGPAKIAFWENEIRKWVESRVRALNGELPPTQEAGG